MRYGQPIVGGHMPYTGPSRQLGERPADERCTGCGRLSYVSGTGARVNPLTEGQCPDCRDAKWKCSSCGSLCSFEDLHDEMECLICYEQKVAA